MSRPGSTDKEGMSIRSGEVRPRREEMWYHTRFLCTHSAVGTRKKAVNMVGGCHGADKLKTPTLREKTCPECGNIIEIFSTDTEVACDRCGFVAHNDIKSCVSWCKYAKLCVGEELYNRIKKSE